MFHHQHLWTCLQASQSPLIGIAADADVTCKHSVAVMFCLYSLHSYKHADILSSDHIVPEVMTAHAPSVMSAHAHAPSVMIAHAPAVMIAHAHAPSPMFAHAPSLQASYGVNLIRSFGNIDGRGKPAGYGYTDH